MSYLFFVAERSAEIEAENARLKELAGTKAMLAKIKAEMASIELEIFKILGSESEEEKVKELAEMDEGMAVIVERAELKEIAEIEAEIAEIEAALIEIAVWRADLEEIAEIEAEIAKLKVVASSLADIVEIRTMLAEIERAEMEEWAKFDAWQTSIGEIAEEEGVYYEKGLRDGAYLNLATLKELFTWVGYLIYSVNYGLDCALPAGLYPDPEDIKTIEDFEDFKDNREFTAYWTQYVRGVFDGTETVHFDDWMDDGKFQAASCARDASEFVPFLRENTSYFD